MRGKSPYLRVLVNITFWMLKMSEVALLCVYQILIFFSTVRLFRDHKWIPCEILTNIHMPIEWFN